MKPKIMLVDQCVDFTDTMRVFLNKDYQVLVQNGTLDAIYAARSDPFVDLILADITKDEWNFLKWWQNNTHAPLVLMSLKLDADYADHDHFQSIGVSGYIIKPFKKQNLNFIRDVIERNQKEKKAG